MSENKIYHPLWTGGWDSTYRIVELSRMPVTVEPIYITGTGRKSAKLELEAMDKILEALRKRPETKAELLPVKVELYKDIPENQEITDAYNKIHEKTHLGVQHEWLARYAYVHPGLEIGTEAGVPATSHIIDSIETFGVLIPKDDTFIIDPEKSSKEGMLVLGNFEFPIIDKYESDMLANIKAWGYEDVMSLIWFCHRPIDGKPCGLCHPCAVKMESDMEFLLPEDAQKRYRFQNRLIKIFGRRIGEGLCRRIYKH